MGKRLVVFLVALGTLGVMLGVFPGGAYGQSCELSTTGAVCRRRSTDERQFAVVETFLLWGEEEVLAAQERFGTGACGNERNIDNTVLDVPQFSCVPESRVLYFGTCDNGSSELDDMLKFFLGEELVAENIIRHIPNAPANQADEFETALIVGKEVTPGVEIGGLRVNAFRDRTLQGASFQFVVSSDPTFVAQELTDFCSVELEDVEIIEPEIIEPEPVPDIDPIDTGEVGDLFCDESESRLRTAIGCVPIDNINRFSSFFINWALGIAGGISMIMIVLAGYRMATSQGDRIKLQSSRELLTAAVSGLFLLILTVFALRLIGVQILGVL